MSPSHPMKPRRWIFSLAAFALVAAFAFGQSRGLPADTTAVIVVTGLRLAPDDPAGERTELGVAEGARVTVRAVRDGSERTRPTSEFRGRGRLKGTFFTADFGVELGETYEITMTFRDGTVVRVSDYRLPAEWKTHFYFHNTTGTLSPASILRTVEDPRTRQQCRVYAVFPVASYQALGGTGVP